MPAASTDSRPIRVEVLGGVRVFADGRELDSLTAQRTRCALLVLLAIERDIAKETVVATIWPDAAPENARHTLNQTLYRMRADLGPDWVESRAERLTIADHVTTDVAAFEDALARGDLGRAVDLYTGPFLGAHNPGAGAAFDLWADGHRARLSRAFHDTLRRWVEQRTADGADAETIPAVRRAVDMEPTDDEAQHLLIRLLARTSVRDALDAYGRYVGALALIDAEPAEEIEQLIAEVRDGPRPLPEVALPEPRPRRRPARTGAPAPARRARVSRMLLGAAAAIAAIVFVLRWNTERPGVVTIGQLPIQIFIDEFQDLSAPRSLEPQAGALTQHVANALADVRALVVTSVGRVFPVGAVGTGADSLDAVLRSDFVVGGFLERFDTRYDVTVFLMDPATQSRLASHTFPGTIDAAPEQRALLAQSIADFVRRKVGEEVRSRTAPQNRDQDAVRLIAEAERHAAVSQGLINTRGEYSEAIVELVMADSLLDLAAARAPNDPEPLITRARVAELRAIAERFAALRTDPIAGEKQFRHHLMLARSMAQRVLQRDPDNIDALEARARANQWLASAVPADSAELLLDAALADIREVVEADTLRARAWRIQGELKFAIGDYSRSLTSLETSRELDTFLEQEARIAERLGIIHFELHDDSAADAECERGFLRNPNVTLATCRLLLAAFGSAGPMDSATVQTRIDDLVAYLPRGDLQDLSVRFAPLEALAWSRVPGAGELERRAWDRYRRANATMPNQYAAAYLQHLGDTAAAVEEANAFLELVRANESERRIYEWLREAKPGSTGGGLAAR